MRTLLILFFLIATVLARRSPSTTTTSKPAFGLENVAKDEKEVKPVKRAPKAPTEKTGWFYIDKEKHPYWQQVEENMCCGIE